LNTSAGSYVIAVVIYLILLVYYEVRIYLITTYSVWRPSYDCNLCYSKTSIQIRCPTSYRWLALSQSTISSGEAFKRQSVNDQIYIKYTHLHNSRCPRLDALLKSEKAVKCIWVYAVGASYLKASWRSSDRLVRTLYMLYYRSYIYTVHSKIRL